MSFPSPSRPHNRRDRAGQSGVPRVRGSRLRTLSSNWSRCSEPLFHISSTPRVCINEDWKPLNKKGGRGLNLSYTSRRLHTMQIPTAVDPTIPP
jgi:hypothetical protein